MGLSTGIAMIGVKSLLDIWWTLSGIFAGGMLGLFLLGIISRRTKSMEAFTAVLIGVAVILWMTFSIKLPDHYAFLQSLRDCEILEQAGPFTDSSGGAYVIFADNLERAREITEQDPLHIRDCSQITVREWNAS